MYLVFGMQYKFGCINGYNEPTGIVCELYGIFKNFDDAIKCEKDLTSRGLDVEIIHANKEEYNYKEDEYRPIYCLADFGENGW